MGGAVGGEARVTSLFGGKSTLNSVDPSTSGRGSTPPLLFLLVASDRSERWRIVNCRTAPGLNFEIRCAAAAGMSYVVGRG
jgi:hypothetical protein